MNRACGGFLRQLQEVRGVVLLKEVEFLHEQSHYSCTCVERQEGRPTTWLSELERSHVGLKFGSHLLETVDRQMISCTQIVLVIVLVNGAIS